MLPVIVVLVVVGALGLVVARRRAAGPGRHAAARRPEAATGVPVQLTTPAPTAVAEPEPVAEAPVVEPEPVAELPVVEPVAQAPVVEPEPVVTEQVVVEQDVEQQVVAEAEQVVVEAEEAAAANVTALQPADEPTPARIEKVTQAAAARTRRTTVSVEAGTAPRVRRCGHCRTPGHTRTTCPDLTGARG